VGADAGAGRSASSSSAAGDTAGTNGGGAAAGSGGASASSAAAGSAGGRATSAGTAGGAATGTGAAAGGASAGAREAGARGTGGPSGTGDGGNGGHEGGGGSEGQAGPADVAFGDGGNPGGFSTPLYAGRIDDVSDFMLANAWRPDGGRSGGLPHGWGASDLAVLYWQGMTVATFVPVGLRPAPLSWIPYDDVGDILLGAPQTDMPLELGAAYRVLQVYTYGTYPARGWTPPGAAEGRPAELALQEARHEQGEAAARAPAGSLP
jgi:hypothetical protein